MYATNDSALRAAAMRKVDICASALFEAQRLSGAAIFGALYSQLATKIGEMLDDIDETLLLLDHMTDRGTFERVAALHDGYEKLLHRRAACC